MLDGPSPASPVSPPLPPEYPQSSVPADSESPVDGPLLPDDELPGSVDATWDSFSDLEFPRDALDLIDSLGNSSFGEVRTEK